MNAAAFANKIDNLKRIVEEIQDQISRIEHQVGDLASKSVSQPPDQMPDAKPQDSSIAKAWRYIQVLYKWVGRPLLAPIALAGYFSTFASLRFDIGVSILTSLRTSDPTATRFLATNEGPFGISNVTYACKYVPPRSSGNVIVYDVLVPFPIKHLRSHGTFSVYCAAARGMPAPLPAGTLLDVEISYTPALFFWRRNRGGELFILKFTDKGDAVWLPVKDMTPGAEDLAGIKCGTCGD